MAKYERGILAAIIVVLSGGLYITGTNTLDNMISGFIFGFYLSVFAREMGVI